VTDGAALQNKLSEQLSENLRQSCNGSDPHRIFSRRRPLELTASRLSFPATGSFFEPIVGGVGDVQNESNSASALKREPLVDLAIQIELDGLADFGTERRVRRTSRTTDIATCRISSASS
jgi:hypothetical protein